MSSDLDTWVGPLRPRKARALAELCDADDVPVLAADGHVVFHPGTGKTFDPAAVAAALRAHGTPVQVGHLPANTTDVLSEGEELGIDWDRGRTISSRRTPVGMLVDRLVAMPASVGLLEGRAWVRMRPLRRQRFALEWAKLVKTLGVGEMARRVEPYLSVESPDAVEAFVDAVDRALRLCAKDDRDLFVACFDLSQ